MHIRLSYMYRDVYMMFMYVYCVHVYIRTGRFRRAVRSNLEET